MFSMLAPSPVEVNADSPPGAPNCIHAVCGFDYMMILWENPMIDAYYPDTSVIGFRVYRNGSLLATVDWRACIYRDHDVQEYVYYQYGVSAVSSAGEGPQCRFDETSTWYPEPRNLYDLTLYSSPPQGGFIRAFCNGCFRSGQTTVGNAHDWCFPVCMSRAACPGYHPVNYGWTSAGAISIDTHTQQWDCNITDWWGPATITAYFWQQPYDVTISAECNAEGTDLSMPITMDGVPANCNTPHTFSVTGSHTFTIPNEDANQHPFKNWNTGQTTRTISVSSGGTYTAHYEAVLIDRPVVLDVKPSISLTYQNWDLTFEGRLTQGGTPVENALVSVNDPILGNTYSCYTDAEGYFTYEIRVPAATASGMYFFTFSSGDQVCQTKVLVESSNVGSDTDMLVNMWYHFKADNQFLPLDSQNKIIGWAKYQGSDLNILCGNATTEGQGYSMLRAVWMNDKQTYNAIRDWTDKNMWVNGHLGWFWNPAFVGINGLGSPFDPHNDNDRRYPPSAPDGDEDIALAAVLSYFRWGDSRDRAFALKVLDSFRNYDTIWANNRYYVSWGSSRMQVDGSYVIDPSYMAPYAYRLFAKLDVGYKDFWIRLVGSSYSILSDIQTACSSGLVSNYGVLDSSTGHAEPVADNKVVGGSDSQAIYGYDAFRTMWRLAIDYYYYSEPRALSFLTPVSEFFQEQLRNYLHICDRYNALTANPLPGSYATDTTYGGDIGATMTSNDPDTYAARSEILDLLRSPFAPYGGLYEHSWIWLGLALNQWVVRLFGPSVKMAIHSPASMLITDFFGRRAGINATNGQLIDEIPFTEIQEDPEESIVVYDPMRNNFDIQLTGTANGTYTFDITILEGTNVLPIFSRTGNITLGTSQNISIGIPYRDIEADPVSTYRTIVNRGVMLPMNVTITNAGSCSENVNLTVCANESIICAFSNVSVLFDNSFVFQSVWNTTSFPLGNYTISVHVWPVPGETNAENNTLSVSWIMLTILGDINGDRNVDLKDVYAVGKAYGSVTGDSRYEPNLDINEDSKIDLKDYYTTCKNYGTSW
jgi:endo-1,4-beta-D-glucanase Y/archaellum component FlaF (FlaF/FlaG flagellin family)